MADAEKCAVRGCLTTATMVLTSTLHGARGSGQSVLAHVCPAHANQFRPGTQYTLKREGSIKFGGFRPNCTVETVGPIGA